MREQLGCTTSIHGILCQNIQHVDLDVRFDIYLSDHLMNPSVYFFFLQRVRILSAHLVASDDMHAYFNFYF